jgi:hypothetical protein
MLKKVYIVCLVLLIGIGNVSIMQGGLISSHKSNSSILGVIENKIAIPSLVQNNSNKQASVFSSKSVILPQSSTKQTFEIEIKLDGKGCTENKAPNICKLVSNQSPGLILKKCDEIDWDKCNFYTYELGKRDGDSQFILQTYIENSDRLLDILEYNAKTNIISQIKTLLYQDNLDSASTGNAEYNNTFEQYKAK